MIKHRKIQEYNQSLETKFPMPLETQELQYLKAHRKSFTIFLKKFELNTSQTRRVLKTYDERVKATGKNANILDIYGVNMELFTKHFLANTLHELKGVSTTIHQFNPGNNQPKSDRALKQNIKVLPEPEGRKVRYLAPGVSGEDLAKKTKKIQPVDDELDGDEFDAEAYLNIEED
jgi:hypothetical protein